MEKYIGKVLNDRYMITEVIGVGGMAYVYKAFDKVCNRVVAVKVLKDEFMSDAQFRRRFTNESKAITMLSHGNIVDVYDVSLEGDALYIVMEYIDGITLKEYMEKKGQLSATEALHFIKQILKGLSHAHERGIVHRDIKPHNILLLKDGTIKITDFGIARLTKFDTQTISDMTIGSVHYISPEQASGDRTDERSDIYSVGIILYEMLTGKLPFEADTAVAVALMQVQAQPDLPSELVLEMPQGLEEIVLKAMMKDPAMRYQSAGSILADITLFESDPTIVFNYSAAPIVEEPVFDNSPTIFANDLLSDSEYDEDDEVEDEEEEDYVEDSKFKSTWLPIIAGVGTAFVLLILVGLGIVFQKELFGPKTITCPNVVGMELDDAKASYTFNFVVGSTASSDEHEEGKIISQSPDANSQVKKKGTITVVISSGPEVEDDDKDDKLPEYEDTNYVPGVLTWTKADAIAEFKRQKISYRIETKYDDEVEEGCVISTSPSAGEEIDADETVVIYISKGPEEEKEPEIKTVTMPKLVGQHRDVLKTTLENNKLKLGTVTEEYSDTVEKDYVITQSVLANSSVEEGTTVNVVVSAGKKATPPTTDSGDKDGNTSDSDKDPSGDKETNTNPGDTDTDKKTDGDSDKDNSDTQTKPGSSDTEDKTDDTNSDKTDETDDSGAESNKTSESNE